MSNEAAGELGYAKLLESYLGFMNKLDVEYTCPAEEVFVKHVMENMPELQYCVFLAFFGLQHERRTRHEIATILQIPTSRVDSILTKGVNTIRNNFSMYGFTRVGKSITEYDLLVGFLQACLSRNTAKVFSTKQRYQRIKTLAIEGGYLVETTSRIGRFGIFNTNFKLTPEGLQLLGIDTKK